MVDVTLICVGKLKEKFYQEGAAEYAKRLKGYCKLNIVELAEQKLPKNPSLGEIQGALEKEGDAIRAKIPPNSSVVALAVEGKLRSSEELAAMISTWSHNAAKHLVFVIGGSYGLHPSIKAGAWAALSMSPMTFPHHLARVMLLEQIYRAFKDRSIISRKRRAVAASETIKNSGADFLPRNFFALHRDGQRKGGSLQRRGGWPWGCRRKARSKRRGRS